MSKSDQARRSLEETVEHDLGESLLSCPGCGQSDCLGLCTDLPELALEMSGNDGYYNE